MIIREAVAVAAGDVEDAALAGAELDARDVDLHAARVHEEHHVDALRVLRPLARLGRHLDKARAEIRRAEELGEAERRVLDRLCLDCRGCPRDVLKGRSWVCC